MSRESKELSEGTFAAAAAMPQNMALIKIENESLMALAAAHPRDHKQIMAELKEQLDAYPAFAERAIYRKPVGTVTRVSCRCGHFYDETSRDVQPCPHCGKVDVKSAKQVKKFAEGLSIRAAEALAELYGHNRVRCDAQLIDADTIRIEATFVDLQKGRAWSTVGLLSATYRTREGKVARMPQERFFGTALKAEQSRAIREAITRSIPPGLRAELEQCARASAGRLLTPEKVEAMLAAFVEFQISRDDLEKIIGRTVANWSNSDREALIGIFNSLRDGETDRAELLEGLDEPTPAAGSSESPAQALARSLKAQREAKTTADKSTSSAASETASETPPAKEKAAAGETVASTPTAAATPTAETIEAKATKVETVSTPRETKEAGRETKAADASSPLGLLPKDQPASYEQFAAAINVSTTDKQVDEVFDACVAAYGAEHWSPQANANALALASNKKKQLAAKRAEAAKLKQQKLSDKGGAS